MATAIGKELRKLRIETDERMMDMAERLGKSPAFISAIEVGRKSPPLGFEDLVKRVYGLAGKAAEAIEIAADRSRKVFSVEPESVLGRDTAGLLARRMNTLSDEQLEEIKAILRRGNDE